MDRLIIRTATLEDIQNAAKLHALEKDSPLSKFEKMFSHEFTLCMNSPDQRVYYLAFSEDELVSYAGARSYDPMVDENMYSTSNLLPGGWYLRGIKVHPEWRRKRLAYTMTLKRLEWIKQRSDRCLVFLDDENKITLPMYIELGFKEISRGWEFSDPRRINENTKGILLHLEF